MENFVWLFAVAGGAAILGGAIAFGMFKQNPRRTSFALGAAVVVAILAVVVSQIVSRAPSTAPVKASDAHGSQYDTPARPSDQNALPGLDQKNR